MMKLGTPNGVLEPLDLVREGGMTLNSFVTTVVVFSWRRMLDCRFMYLQ